MLFILVLTNVSLVRFHFVCPDDFSLDGNSDVPVPEETACRPTILSQLTKATVIKRADEFMVSDDNGQRPDLVIFSCQDSYIYILGPVRYPLIRFACVLNGRWYSRTRASFFLPSDDAFLNRCLFSLARM